MNNLTALYQSKMHNPSTALAEYVRSNGTVVIGEKNRRVLNGDYTVPALSSSSVFDHYFKLDKIGNNFYDSLKLYMQVTAPTATSSTYCRFVNNFGIFFAERFQLWYAGKMISEVTSDEAFIKMSMNNDADEYSLLMNSIGNGSTTVRNSAAAAAQTFVLELDEIIDVLRKPLPRHLLNSNDDFRLMVRVRSIGDLVETDGTAPTFSFSTFQLWYTLAQSNQYIDNFVLEKMSNPYGLSVDQVESISQDVACSAATSTSVRIANLRDKEVVYMAIYARTAATAADKMFSTFSGLISSWNLKSAMKYVHGAEFDYTKEMFYKSLLLNYKPANMDIFLTNNIFFISFAESLDKSFSENSSYSWYGSKSFGDEDVDLNVNFSSAFTGTLTVRTFRIKPTLIVNNQIVSSQ